MGRQFNSGQLQTGSLFNISSSYAITASFALNGGGNTFPFSGSAVITGSLYVSGSGITGSLSGTASVALTAQTASYVLNSISSSFATTASYVVLAQTASYVTTAQTASFVITAQTASYVVIAQTASFVATAQTASYVLNAVSSSFAITASYILNAISASFASTASLATRASGSLTGSLLGTAATASFVTTAQTASFVLNAVSSSFATTAATASYVQTAQTASYVLNAVSSSFATTASFALTSSNAPNYLPLAGGTMTGDIYAAGRTFTLQDLLLGAGTIFGKITTDGSKYISVMPTYNVESARFWPNGNVTIQNAGTYVDNGFRLDVIGSGRFTDSLTAVNGITGSLLGTASYATQALSASYAPITPAFPFTGSAQITGSLTVTGSIIATAGFTGSLFGTASVATTASYVLQAVSASYATTALSASYATTASYALNGGVTQLLAGPNVTLSPTNGLGQVTVSATLSGSTNFNTATGSYGSFYSTQTQTNVAGTARSMSLNITDITNGVSISGSTNPYNTYIKTQNAGVYDIQFSAQVDKTDSGTDEIWIWIRKNGTDISDSATSIQLVGNGAHYVAAWNFFVNAAVGDYFQLMWYSPDANVRLHAESAFGVVPGIPSLIVTANRVDQFLSNTGSFSGSFTGNLIGTASYATTALSSSYATTASYSNNSTSASFATTALSSSYALSASYALGGGNPFPFNGNAQISGSFGVTGSFGVQTYDAFISNAFVNAVQITDTNRTLYDIFGNTSIDAGGRILTDMNALPSANWMARTLFDSSPSPSINWGFRYLYNSSGSISLDWETGVLTGSLLGTASYATTALSSSFAATASFAVTASYALSSAGGPGGDTTAVEAQTWFLM